MNGEFFFELLFVRELMKVIQMVLNFAFGRSTKIANWTNPKSADHVRVVGSFNVIVDDLFLDVDFLLNFLSSH